MNEVKTLKVEIKNNYGRDMVYPVCEDSHRFANLCGGKTLGEVGGNNLNETNFILTTIKGLGYEFEVVNRKL